MKRKIFTALLSFAVVVGTVTAVNDIIPTLRLSPVEGSVIVVIPEEVFTISIRFSKTSELFYGINDRNQRISLPFPGEYRNDNEEHSIMFNSVIDDYGVEKCYYFYAYSEDGNMVQDNITYKTISEPE